MRAPVERSPLAALAALLALSACGPKEPAPEAPPETRNAAAVPAVDGFDDVGGAVAALALIPSKGAPWLGRGLVALEGGGLVILDLNETKMLPAEGPNVTSIAVAPEFALRGSEAPLVVMAGGALADPKAFLFLPSEDAFIEAPIAAIAPGINARLVCTVRATGAFLDVLAVGASSAERWRLRDTGEELLSAEKLADEPAAAGATSCGDDGADGAVVIRADGTVHRLSAAGDETAPVSGGAGVAGVVDFGRVYALVARPQDGALTAASFGEGAVARRIVVEAAMNAAGAGAPMRIAVSDENFGGPYPNGVALVSDGTSVSVLALEMVREAATRAPGPS